MAITGRIKIFEPSYCLGKDGNTAAASSGDGSASNILDFNKDTRWQSVGSDDTTTETITVTFDEVKTFRRLLLVRHNFENYTIDPIGAGSDFQNVTSIISSIPGIGIDEIGYNLNTSYYEFDAISASGLTITVTVAQEVGGVGDQEKYLYILIITDEANQGNGTFISFPQIENPTEYNITQVRMVNNTYKVTKLRPNLIVRLNCSFITTDNEAALYEHLRLRSESFILWVRGGAVTKTFRFEVPPYRLEDVYQMQVVGSEMLQPHRHVYSNYHKGALNLREVLP